MSGHPLATAAALAVLAATPALAGDIPFTARNDDTNDWCLSCKGPWARTSLLEKIPAGGSKQFYKAKEDIFSPFGKWSCTTNPLNFDDTCNYPIGNDPPPEASVDFCLANIPSNEVDLVIAADGRSISVNFTPPPCNATAVKAQLGDDGSAGASSSSERSRYSRRSNSDDGDQDTFWIEAAEGDDLRVRLEADGEGGSRGEHATLVLMGRNGNVLEKAEGPLPLEIAATAQRSGRHQIRIQQGSSGRRHRWRRSAGDPFTGGYVLRVLNSGELADLEPSTDVEP